MGAFPFAGGRRNRRCPSRPQTRPRLHRRWCSPVAGDAVRSFVDSVGRSLIVIVAVTAVTACGDVAFRPSPLEATSVTTAPVFVLGSAVEGRPDGGKTRTLQAGSLWSEVGRTAEGTVYRPRGSVLTAEGVHVREAYLVVREGTWVGLWLPYEKAFSPLTTAVPITLGRQGSP